MALVIDVLRQEHANMLALMKTLESQVVEFEQGGSPDYDLIRAALDYFLAFPDLYHHPKEDLVYARLRAVDPAAAEQIGDLRREHERLAQRSRDFSEGLRAILEEVEVSRESFSRWARGFLDLQWRHMQMEEESFFPVALAALGDDDWRALATEMTEVDDPLFGERVGERFENLRQRVLRWDS